MTDELQMCDEIIYSINREDIQTVAQDALMRDLTAIELKRVADILGDYIDWFGAIESAIQHVMKNEK